MAYAQARRDFEYLESIAELEDCVEIDAQVFELMQAPTKARAAQLYESAILSWLGENRMRRGGEMDRRTKAIARRYFYE